MNCQKHPSGQLKVYCETCEQLICRDCTVSLHRDHQYDLVGDCFPKHRDAITASLQSVKQKLGIVNQALPVMDARSRRVKEQGDAIKQEVQIAIDQLHSTLEVRKRDLMIQIDQMVQQTGQAVQSQREGYEQAQTQLSSCLEFVEGSLQTGSQEEILSMRKQIVERVKVTEAIDLRKFQAEPKLMFQFTHQHLVESCRRFGEVQCHMTPLCPEKCYITGDGAQKAIRGEMATLTLYTVDKEGRECVDCNAPITGELVSRSDGLVVHCEVVEERNNGYDLQYLPRSQGQHDLHIKVDGIHIGESPMVVRVVGDFMGTHVKTIEGVKKPWRLAITENGEMVVAENAAECVSVFDHEGHKLRSFGENKGEHPLGVALCNDNTVLVTSCGEYHRVRRFTLDGQLIACSAGDNQRGSLDSQFNTPWAVATSPTNDKVYVCDTFNNRIQVLNSDLTYSSTIGNKGSSKGSNPGEFNEPGDIAVDKDGNMFVADTDNNRIQVFDSSGQFLREFQKLGPGMEELEGPTSVCIDRNTVYVLDCDKYAFENGKRRLSMFDKKGNYVKSYFGKKAGDKPGELNSSYGIAVDNGYVYVSDTDNHRIKIFE